MKRKLNSIFFLNGSFMQRFKTDLESNKPINYETQIEISADNWHLS